MIVTQQLLIDLQACQDAIDWAVQKQVINSSKDEVIQALWNDRQSDWYLWAKETLNSAEAIKLVNHEFFGPYRVGSQEFETLELAQQKIQELRNEFNAQYVYLYSVNALITLLNGDVSIYPCDILSETFNIPDTNCYEAFDHEIGIYIKFTNYIEARQYALRKKLARELITNQQFFVEQQIREIGGTVSAWTRIS